MPTKNIRVLLVDDSPIALTALSRILSTAPDIHVVGTARNGKDALELVPRLDPDVICTDLYMPVMDGLELTREVMERYPRPILVISVAVRSDDPHNAFQLLEAGAVDVLSKPRMGLDPADRQLAEELVRKIRVLSGVVVIPKHKVRERPLEAADRNRVSGPIDVIAIGASTGGPQALQTIFSELPADLPVPILCVQHIGSGFTEALIDWLRGHTRLTIRFAQPGAPTEPGTVYFAPEGSVLELDRQQLLQTRPLKPGEHSTQVDLVFRAAAKRFGPHAAGVLLSGMGRDGADGMRAIAEAGGLTVAQDEATSIVFGMPASAIANGSAQHVLPLPEIAGFLLARIHH